MWWQGPNYGLCFGPSRCLATRLVRICRLFLRLSSIVTDLSRGLIAFSSRLVVTDRPKPRLANWRWRQQIKRYFFNRKCLFTTASVETGNSNFAINWPRGKMRCILDRNSKLYILLSLIGLLAKQQMPTAVILSAFTVNVVNACQLHLLYFEYYSPE